MLLYDFLFGKKLAGACSGKYRKAVVKQKKELKAELQKMKEKKGATSSSDLLPSQVKDEGKAVSFFIKRHKIYKLCIHKYVCYLACIVVLSVLYTKC